MQENIIITAVGDILFCRSINDYSNIFTHINKYTNKLYFKINIHFLNI